jgi:hypothetical protein
MRFMNEEGNRQRFEEHMRQVEEEQNRKQPDLSFQRSTGCIIGGILGPALLTALLFLAAAMSPDNSGGSPIAFLILVLMAIPVGGAFGALLTPFIAKLVNSGGRRKSK